MNCPTCEQRLDTLDRRPKSLPCGHTVCLSCLKRLEAQTCPHCQKEFDGVAVSLPDNLFLLGLIEKKQDRQFSADQKFWCRACAKVAEGACADEGHSLCTPAKRRAEQAAPQLQQLQAAAASAHRVVQALEAARDVAATQLLEWRGTLLQLERAEGELRAAVDRDGDLPPAQPEGLERLQTAAALLDATFRLNLLLDGDGAQWSADLRQAAPGASRSLLDVLVLQLHQEGSMLKVTKHKRKTCGPLCGPFRPDECLSVSKQCKQDNMQNVLHDVDKVRKLTDADCKTHPLRCHTLLQRVAPLLVALEISNPRREHLAAVQEMPALRCFYIDGEGNYPAGCDEFDLPRNLEDLSVTNVLPRHLQCVLDMPSLRKLTLYCFRVHDMEFPPLPAGHRGLQWLGVGLRPLSTAVSLVKAHGATLLELRVQCASEGISPWHFPDLAEQLGQCGLRALRRLVLLRFGVGITGTRPMQHGKGSCRVQKRAMEEVLRGVRVLCELCDDCPLFPGLGDFTWHE